MCVLRQGMETHREKNSVILDHVELFRNDEQGRSAGSYEGLLQFWIDRP